MLHRISYTQMAGNDFMTYFEQQWHVLVKAYNTARHAEIPFLLNR